MTMAGFEAVWSAVDPGDLPPPPPPNPCEGGISLTGGGTIDFSGGYSNNQFCSWTLTCPGTMTLDFLTFQTEGNFDYVFVYDGVSTSAPTLLSTSGSSTPSDQSSSGSSLLVEFMSDYSVTGDGFSANWECAELGDPCDGGMSLSGGFAIDFEGTTEGTDCAWTLSCAVGPVYLSFQSLEAGAGNPVQLYDGELSQQLGTDITGTDLPEQQISTSSTLIVQTSGSSTFMAHFECSPPPDPCAPGGADLTGTSDIVLGSYGNGEDCSWNVECPSGPVTLMFESFQTESNFDFVYVDNDASTLGQGQLGTFHGTSVPGPITSTGSTMSIRFTSDGSVTNDGFAGVAACPPPPDPCESTVTLLGSSAIDFSQGYDNGADCNWSVQCDSGPVTLTFQSFQTEGNFDYVYVNGEEFHGSQIPGPITSQLPTVSVRFTSDGSVVGEGFSLVVDCPASLPGGHDAGQDACDGGMVLHGDNEIDFSTGPVDMPPEPPLPASCRQARDHFGITADGVTTIRIPGDASTTQVYCDMTRNGGGWTLLVTASSADWNTDRVRSWNAESPSITDNYSMLDRADAIRDLSSAAQFEYRLEANDFGRFGGVFTAPSSYTFTSTDNSQTAVTRTEQFDSWNYHDSGVEQRMPWIGNAAGELTTSASSSAAWWGTICSSNNYSPAPWMSEVQPNPGMIWYWVREGSSPAPPPMGGDPCSEDGQTLTNSGVVSLGDYANSMSCSWNVECHGGPVTLSFQEFATESNFDFVYVDNDASSLGQGQLGTFHGTGVPGPITSTGSTMSIRFTSDGSVTMSGFTAFVECGESPPAPSQTCVWDMNCVNPPVQLAFEFFDAVEGGQVYEGDTNLATLTDTLPFGSVPSAPWIQTSGGNSLGFELSLSSTMPSDFRATVQCPNDVHEPAPAPPVGDPCSGGQVMSSSGPITFLGGYDNNMNCYWDVQCGDGPITLSFVSFQTEGNFDFVIVDGESYHGDEIPAPIVSQAEAMAIHFTSDGSVLGDGFAANVECPPPGPPGPPPPVGDPCAGGQTVSGGAVSLTDYSDNMNCVWDVECSSGGPITLSFESFNTEANFDYVIVDGEPLHGGSVPDPIVTDASTMHIQFTSDGSVVSSGFEALVSCGGESGRRRQQAAEVANTTTARDLIAEVNDDAFQFKSDRCIVCDGSEDEPCGALASPTECQAVEDMWVEEGWMDPFLGRPHIPRDSPDREGDAVGGGDRANFIGNRQDSCEEVLGCKFLKGQEAFVFLIPLDFSEQTIELNISSLVDYLWMDQKTRDVEVRFATYNGNQKLFSIVHMKMEFELSGQSKKSLLVDSVNLELTATSLDALRMFMELLIVAFTGLTLVSEMKEVLSDGLFVYVKDFWNFVDILNIWLYVWAAITWFYLFIVSMRVNIPNKFDMSKPEDTNKLLAVMDDLDQGTQRFNTYIMLTAINVLVCFTRLFKFIKVQERLNIINETLAKAAIDLLHFLIALLLSYVCFAVMGCVMFGFKMTEFKSVTDALHALFNMSIGDTGLWEEMRAIHGMWGILYQYTFFVFMSFIMINIFLAIIMDSYAEVVGEARSQGAHTIMQDMRKAQAVFATSGKNPLPVTVVGRGTRVDYKEAQEYAKDPVVERLTKSAAEGQDIDFTPEVMKHEVRPELTKFLSDTYSRLAEGESDEVGKPPQFTTALCILPNVPAWLVLRAGDLADVVRQSNINQNHRFNEMEADMKAMEERIMKAILGKRKSKQSAESGQDDT